MNHLKPYRNCVGLLVINKNGDVFIGKRIDSNLNAWQMPQGGIEADEDPKTAGIREMEEEIGTKNAELIGEMSEWLNYDIPENLSHRLWNGKYRGQTQKWLAFKFLGDDSEINIKTKVPEFKEWKWENHKNLPSLAVPFKRDIYKKVIKEFEELFFKD
jgi:putative (di)nucleoside polyphosphate hydrolase